MFFANDTKVFLTTNNPSFKKERGQEISFNRLQLLYTEKDKEGEWTAPVALPSTRRSIRWVIRRFRPTVRAYIFAPISRRIRRN